MSSSSCEGLMLDWALSVHTISTALCWLCPANICSFIYFVLTTCCLPSLPHINQPIHHNRRSIVGFKATAGFKATDKSGGNTAIAAIKNLGANLVNAINSGTGTANASNLPVSSAPSPLAAAAAGPKPVAPPKVIIGPNGQRIVQRPMTQAEVMQVRVSVSVCWFVLQSGALCCSHVCGCLRLCVSRVDELSSSQF